MNKEKGLCRYYGFNSDENLKFPSLPEPKDFDYVVGNDTSSEEDYDGAQRVCLLFECKCVEEYLTI